jgi:hypothetical protein
MPLLTDTWKLAAKGRGATLVNVLVVSEPLPTIDWPETGFWEASVPFVCRDSSGINILRRNLDSLSVCKRWKEGVHCYASCAKSVQVFVHFELAQKHLVVGNQLSQFLGQQCKCLRMQTSGC